MSNASAPGQSPISPADLNTLLSSVERAVAAGEIAQACEMAHAALDAGHSHPSLFGVLAYDARTRGDLRSALKWLSLARSGEPRNIDILHSLGSVMFEMGEFEGAIVAFDQLLAIVPTHVPALYDRGMAREKGGDLAGARQDYERAVAMQPRHAAALSRLSYLATLTGNLARSHALAQRALAVDPGNPVAIIAQISADLAAKQFTSAHDRAQDLLMSATLAPMHRAIAQNLLGDALDGLGESDAAFAAYANCNELLLQLHQKDAVLVNGESAVERAERIAQFFSDNPVSQSTTTADESAPETTHVFLLGFPRSGTTLLEMALKGHSQISTSEENELLTDSVRRFFETSDGLQHLAQMTDEELKAWRDAYWQRIEGFNLRKGRSVFVDKLPLNTILLPLLARLFPKAKILFAVRDPRNVVMSCFRRRFAMNPHMYQLLSLAGTARYYAAAMRVASLSKRTSNLSWQNARHEDLVADFEGELKKICAFLGLQWEADMGDVARRARQRAVNTPSTVQLSQGLGKADVSDWRRYREQLAPVTPVLAPWIAHFGYPQD